MSQVIGADISFYQNNIETPKRIDFVKMHTLAEFVIIRAGQNLWMDRDVKWNWSDAKQAGIPRGSYWFYDSRANPKWQAELWVKTLGGDLGELPMFLDLEETYGGPYGGWRSWRVFLDHLKTLVGNKEIGIYTGFYYFRDNTPSQAPLRLELEYFHQYPLWIANYSMPKPLIPFPWEDIKWLLWQYTAVGNGAAYGVESKGIDLSYFNGSLEEFRARFHLPTPGSSDLPNYY